MRLTNRRVVLVSLAIATTLAFTTVVMPALGGRGASKSASATKTARQALRIAKQALNKASVAGPAGAPGATGSAGAAGAAGAARAYGLAASTTGAVSRGANATGTHPGAAGTGVYCISVPGVSSADTPILLSMNFSNDHTSPGTSTFVDAADPVTGALSTQAFAEWEPNNPTCSAGQFEVHTFVQSLSVATNQLIVQPDDEGFAFMVP